jgi:predicted nucleic acid-binding Zn ribbon protein
MPTYEFRCPDGTVIERIFKMSEVPDTIPSPAGDGDAVRMISGGAGLVFKGSGFYITDYGKDGKKDQRDIASKAAESAKTSATPAAAPAAKPEAAAPAAPAAPSTPAS